jgi:dipeptidyl aminopeptidase/acylaminoacyl peptidase
MMPFCHVVSRARWRVPFRRSLLFLPLIALAVSVSARAQDRPRLVIDKEVTAFDFSPTGRIAFAVRHVFSDKTTRMQRDDLWIAETDGKKHRILEGEKFVHGTLPFSYTVRALRWSPDGDKLTADLSTSEMINENGDTREGVMTLLLGNTGEAIPIAGGDNTIPGGTNAVWLSDEASVVYLTTAYPADKLFRLNRVRPAAGPGVAIFQGHWFTEVALHPKLDLGVGIERDQGMTGPPRLVTLDLARETSHPLTTLQGYAGGLTISPSGKKVAYWINNEQLEVREIDAPERVSRVRVGVGTLAWSGDETRVLVKRGPERRSGDLIWVKIPPLRSVEPGAAPALAEVIPQPILHDLAYRGFEISPDGKSLAVVEPGGRNIYVYPIP